MGMNIESFIMKAAEAVLFPAAIVCLLLTNPCVFGSGSW